MHLFPALQTGVEQTPEMSDAHFQGLIKNVAEVESYVADVLNRAAAISGSTKFTREGKTTELRALSADVAKEIAKEFPDDRYAALLAQIERAFGPRKTAPPTELQEARFREIRDQLRIEPDLRRDEAFRVAVVEGDQETIDAIETAPRIVANALVRQSVRDGLREQILQARYATANPEKWTELQSARQADATFRDAMKSARAALRNAGVILADETHTSIRVGARV